MGQFWAFVKKEFYHMFRDRWTLVILLLMPVVTILLFGFAVSTQVRNMNVALLVPRYDETVRSIAKKMDAGNVFTVSRIVYSAEEMDEAFRRDEIDFALIFDESFDENLYSADGASLVLVADASNSNVAASALMYAQSIVSECVAESSSGSAMGGVVPQVRMLYNPQILSSFNFVPGLMGFIIILICAMMTSISIVREKEKGTMELLLVSPARPLIIVLSKMVPYIFLSFVNYLTILVLARWALNVPLAGSFWILSLLSLIYIIVSLALGLLISTKTNTQIAALLGSGMVLMVPVMFLSGLFFPIESMPRVFHYISMAVPARWYVTAAKKLMIQGLEFRYVMREFLILGGMALFLIVLGLKSVKNRLS